MKNEVINPNAEKILDIAELPYDHDEYRTLKLLSAVLSNPLCCVVFEVRNHGFCDFHEREESMTKEFAIELIALLQSCSTAEEQIKHFVNRLSELWSAPPTQKYMLEEDDAIKVTSEIEVALSRYANSISSQSDYKLAYQQMKRLIKNESDMTLFDAIKFDVAASILSKNLYIKPNYDDLIQEISEHWDASSHAKYFRAALKACPFYQELKILTHQEISSVFSNKRKRVSFSDDILCDGDVHRERGPRGHAG